VSFNGEGKENVEICLLINQILEKKFKLCEVCLTKKLIIVFVMFIPDCLQLITSDKYLFVSGTIYRHLLP
jgi:hypothetical protein